MDQSTPIPDDDIGGTKPPGARLAVLAYRTLMKYSLQPLQGLRETVCNSESLLLQDQAKASGYLSVPGCCCWPVCPRMLLLAQETMRRISTLSPPLHSHGWELKDMHLGLLSIPQHYNPRAATG